MNPFRRGPGRPPHPDVLTPAEWRVLDEVRAGRTNAEVASRLGLSPNTVKTHLSRIMDKLDVRDRVELAAWQGEPVEASRPRLRYLLPPAALGWVAKAIAGVVVGAGLLGGVFLAISASGAREGVEPVLAPLATATATLAPSATATAPASTPTGTPTAAPPVVATEAAATPVAPPAVAPTAAPTLSPIPGTPWRAADFVQSLAAAGLDVAPSGEVVVCAGGLPGARYGGDASFVLWEYPDAAAVADEWYVHYSFTTHHHVFECNRPPARIYHRDNLVLWVSGDDPQGYDIGNRLIGMDSGVPVPSDIHQFALVAPAAGSPFGGEDLIAALARDGLTYVPYEQPAGCSGSPSLGVLQALDGPVTGEGTIGATILLWTYPDVAALEEEWLVGEDGTLGAPGVHASRFPDCVGTSGSVYIRENMLMWIGGGTWETEPAYRDRVVTAFQSMTP